jgi:hypothetical protein
MTAERQTMERYLAGGRYRVAEVGEGERGRWAKLLPTKRRTDRRPWSGLDRLAERGGLGVRSSSPVFRRREQRAGGQPISRCGAWLLESGGQGSAVLYSLPSCDRQMETEE